MTNQEQTQMMVDGIVEIASLDPTLWASIYDEAHQTLAPFVVHVEGEPNPCVSAEAPQALVEAYLRLQLVGWEKGWSTYNPLTNEFRS